MRREAEGSTHDIASFVLDLLQIVSDPETSFDRKVQDFLTSGCELFDLETGILAEVEGDRYTIRQVCSPDGKLGFPPTMDFLEPLTLLAHVASITKNVRLGTSVLVLPMRQPVLHAKIMATIDVLSGGRFVLGAGVGWWEQEFEVLSVPFEKRAAMMREHGLIGRGYSGKVVQIISGSIGLDDWEWGVDLFAEDPVVFKKLIYEMRFDEASADYAEFGPFYVGLRLPAADLPRLLEGRFPV